MFQVVAVLPAHDPQSGQAVTLLTLSGEQADKFELDPVFGE